MIQCHVPVETAVSWYNTMMIGNEYSQGLSCGKCTMCDLCSLSLPVFNAVIHTPYLHATRFVLLYCFVSTDSSVSVTFCKYFQVFKAFWLWCCWNFCLFVWGGGGGGGGVVLDFKHFRSGCYLYSVWLFSIYTYYFIVCMAFWRTDEANWKSEILAVEDRHWFHAGMQVCVSLGTRIFRL